MQGCVRSSDDHQRCRKCARLQETDAEADPVLELIKLYGNSAQMTTELTTEKNLKIFDDFSDMDLHISSFLLFVSRVSCQFDALFFRSNLQSVC